MAFLARHLSQDSQRLQPTHQVVGGVVGGGDQRFDGIHTHDRPVEQAFQHTVAVSGGAAQMIGDQGSVLPPQRQYAPRREARFLADLRHAPQKEGQPALPFALYPYRLQMVEICLAVLLEVVREVEHRFLQDAFFGEKEGDQQPPHPPVPIQAGMDRFELGMGQANADQGRQIILLVQKPLQSPKLPAVPPVEEARKLPWPRCSPPARSNSGCGVTRLV